MHGPTAFVVWVLTQAVYQRSAYVNVVAALDTVSTTLEGKVNKSIGMSIQRGINGRLSLSPVRSLRGARTGKLGTSPLGGELLLLLF